MAANPDIFPSFFDLSRQAREIERNLLPSRPSQLAGTLHQEDGFSIFPREFEEYTAAYVVSEAQKIERRVFAAGYQPQAASQPGAQYADRTSAAAEPPARFSPQHAPIQWQGQMQPPSSEALPAGQQYAAPSQPEKEKQQYAVLPPQERARISPPKLPSLKPVQEQEPGEAEAGEGMEQGGPAEPEAEEEKEVAVREEQPAKPASSLSSSSKISPRLRAIIEEKLRREEERAPQEEVEIEKEPEEASGPEEKEGEAPAFSARERLLRRLQRQQKEAGLEERQGAKEETQPPEQEEFAPDEPEEEEKEQPIKRALFPKRLEEEEEQEERPSKRAVSRVQPEEKEPGDETEEEEQVSKRTAQPIEKEHEGRLEPKKGRGAAEELPRRAKGRGEAALPGKRAGPITITQIFTGEEEEKPEQEEQPAPASSEKRMERIRRIIDELSPDRAKAQALSPGRSPQAIVPEGEPEEEQAAEREKAKPLKKPAGKKQEEAAPEEERPEGAEGLSPEWDENQEQEQAPKVPGAPARGAAAQALKGKAPQKKQAREKKAAAAQAWAEKQAAALPAKKPAKPVSKAFARQEAEPAQQLAAAKARAAPMQPVARQPAPQAVARTALAAARQVTPVARAAPQPVARQAEIARIPLAARAAPAAARAAPQPVARQAAPAQIARAAPAMQPRSAPILRPTVQPISRAAARQPSYPPPASGARPRILPGGLSQQATPRTYVPPTRRALVPPEQPAPPGGEEPPDEGQENSEEQPPQQKRRVVPPQQEGEQPTRRPAQEERQAPRRRAVPAEEEQPEENAGQEEGSGQEEEPVQVSSTRARLASAQPLSGTRPAKAALDEQPGQKTPEEIEEEKRIASKAAILSQMAKTKEIGGEAELPDEKDDELEVPVPPPEDSEPAPQEYEEAKEGFKAKMQNEGIREKTKEGAEAMIEAYAKENLVWLYEIYSMGGMPRADFLQRAREKMEEAGLAAAQPAPSEAPPNPALANLGKEIDKRYKK